MKLSVENVMKNLLRRAEEVQRAEVNMGVQANMNVQMKVEDKLYKSKRIMLFGEITCEAVDSIIKQMLTLPRNIQSVELWIKSDGGNVEDGFGLLDFLGSRPYIVKTVGLGYVNSMAVPLLSAGTKGHRYIGENTSLMVHEIVWGSQGSHTEMKIKGDQTKYLTWDFLNIFYFPLIAISSLIVLVIPAYFSFKE